MTTAAAKTFIAARSLDASAISGPGRSLRLLRLGARRAQRGQISAGGGGQTTGPIGGKLRT